MPGDVFAEIIRLAAGLAGAAGERAIHHHGIAGLEPETSGPTAASARRRADDQRQLALA